MSGSPIADGIKGRCPDCGSGSLFSGFLKYAPSCAACGKDFKSEDAGDGPAVFVIFIAGFFIVPLALVFQLALDAPVWLTMIVWGPIILISSILLLRPLRGIMLTLQLSRDAGEAQFEHDLEDEGRS